MNSAKQLAGTNREVFSKSAFGGQAVLSVSYQTRCTRLPGPSVLTNMYVQIMAGKERESTGQKPANPDLLKAMSTYGKVAKVMST